jgi:hypothetical protein
MSQADANSVEGDTRDKPTTTGTGCYKNYDHNLFVRSNNSKKCKKPKNNNNQGDEDIDPDEENLVRVQSNNQILQVTYLYFMPLVTMVSFTA